MGMRVRPAVRPASGRTCCELVSGGREYFLHLTYLPEQRGESHWSVRTKDRAGIAGALPLRRPKSRLSGC
jgi:hypothetical protein